MTATQKSVNPPELKAFSVHRKGKLDRILGRIDLIAIVIALLGACLAGVAAVVLAAVELARLIASAWADPLERWLMVALGVALVWVVARWKKLCVF